MTASTAVLRRWLRITVIVVGGAAATSDAAQGTSSAPAVNVSRVLHVCDCPPEMAQEERNALLRAFARRGYVQGRNLDLATFDVQAVADASARGGPLFTLGKDAGGDGYARFLAREIARSKARLVLASGVRVTQGANEATRETPIVFWRITDPVGFGFVDSMAQPGRNLTGFSRALERLTVKRLELLHEMLPRARRIGFLFIADYAHHQRQAGEVRRAGEGLGVSIVDVPLPANEWSPGRLEQIFAGMRQAGIEALLLPDLNVQGQLVVALAAKHRMPSIHALAHAVTAWGGLAAYTTAASEELPGVSAYAVRILNGEKPSALPVQEPTQYELVLNSRAARDLGVSFPRSFKLRATSVVDK